MSVFENSKKKFDRCAYLMLIFLLLSGCAEEESERPSGIAELGQPIVKEEAPVFPSDEPMQTEEEPEEEDHIVTITISSAGDCTLGTTATQDGYSFASVYREKQDPAYFFSNVYDIFSEDSLTVVNLEGPLTTSTSMRADREFNIKGDPSYAKILTMGSVEAVGFANNHRLDYLEQGVSDTVAALESEEIHYAFEDTVTTYMVDGVCIGILAVQATAETEAVRSKIQKDISMLQNANADIIVALIHWGTEKKYEPDDYQISLGHKCIDWGVDVVFGSHPHVLQGIEKYNGKIICYSLGNFCFGANRNPSDKDTMIVQQVFTFVDGQRQQDCDFRVIPCSLSSVGDKNDFCPTPAIGTESTRILEKMNSLCTGFGVEFDEEGRIQ